MKRDAWCIIGPWDEALAQKCEFSHLSGAFWCKMLKKCSFSAINAVFMQKYDLYVENADYVMKIWKSWWKYEICTKCSFLDAEYWLYVKNDDFSHRVVEMIITIINMQRWEKHKVPTLMLSGCWIQALCEKWWFFT